MTSVVARCSIGSRRGDPSFAGDLIGGNVMIKKNAGEQIYKVIEVIGTSTKSWEDAATNAVETAAKSLRDLRIAEVVKMDMKVDGGKVVAFRTRVLVSFKYDV